MSEKPYPACCPICDNAMEDFVPVALYVAHGCKCLAHEDCIASLEEEKKMKAKKNDRR